MEIELQNVFRILSKDILDGNREIEKNNVAMRGLNVDKINIEKDIKSVSTISLYQIPRFFSQ
jgi:hypothetical protein